MMRPFQQFVQAEASSGVLLLACAAAAMFWANSPWSHSYHALWASPVTLGAGAAAASFSLHQIVNDALMVVFFFVVGLEIKRELLRGELSSIRKASLPVAAALGGMVVPAGIYLLFNHTGPASRGWGVPMATDIAFAVGVMVLLGNRVSPALKVFLTALAIADDIGAVMVIALFYSHGISTTYLAAAGTTLAAMAALNLLGERRPLVYFLLGVLLWLFVLRSGVHATIAGVLAAAVIPARSRINGQEFIGLGRERIDMFERTGDHDDDVVPTEFQQSLVRDLEVACENVQTPLDRLTHALHPWVAFVIMPLFALANAGVTLTGRDIGSFVTHPIFLGVFLGLVLGKQIGVTMLAWLGVKMGWGELPSMSSWRQVHGVSCIAGIGFTMSLFVAELAFGASAMLDTAKLGILVASAAASILGWAALALAPPADN